MYRKVSHMLIVVEGILPWRLCNHTLHDCTALILIAISTAIAYLIMILLGFDTGLQYVEIESHINDDGTETICDEPFSIFKKHVCRSKGKKRIIQNDEALEADYGNVELSDAYLFPLKAHATSAMVTTCGWALLQPYLATAASDGTVKIWDVNAEDNANADDIKKSSHKPFIYNVISTLTIAPPTTTP